MHKLRIFGIFAALALLIAACGDPTVPGDTHQLTVNVVGDGTVNFDTATGDDAAGTNNIAAGSEVTLVATPAAGQEFDGWTGDECAGEGTTCTFTMDSDKTITATFEAATPGVSDLTVNVVGSGTVTFDDAAGADAVGTNEFADGTEVTLFAAPAAGFNFVGWTGDECAAAGETCTFTIDSDTTVTATFAEPLPAEVPVTVVIQGDAAGTVTQADLGINCSYDGTTTSGTCTADAMPTDAPTTFTAAPAAGMSVEWVGIDACADDALTCDVTPTTNPYEVTVRFFDPSGPAVETGSVQVSAGADDGHEWVDDSDSGIATHKTGYTYNNLTYAGLSYLENYTAEVVSAFIFRDLGIPDGAVIQSAWLEFTGVQRSGHEASDGNNADLVLRAVAELEPEAITHLQPGNGITGRARVGGGAGTEVAVTVTEDWVENAQHNIEGLEALLQAIVDQDGWDETADAMIMVFNNDASPEQGWRKIQTFEADSAEAATLHFTYTVP